MYTRLVAKQIRGRKASDVYSVFFEVLYTAADTNFCRRRKYLSVRLLLIDSTFGPDDFRCKHSTENFVLVKLDLKKHFVFIMMACYFVLQASVGRK